MRRIATLIALILVTFSLAQATEVSFRFVKADARQVFLAGSFNGWDPAANLMQDEGEGAFAITLDLAPGEYLYKFVADGTWIEDPHAPDYVDDGFGGQNGVFSVDATPLRLGGEGSSAPAPATAAAGEVEVLFSFQPKTGGVRDVFLAGSFNGWAADKDRLGDADGDGVYELTLAMPQGRHLYKFVVDGTWLEDENAADFEDDGFGGQNSVIFAGEGGAAATGMYRVPFRFEAPGQPQGVFLAGSFNDWNPDKNAMSDADADGTWELILVLPAGEHQYKFVADGNWITDENADAFVDDGFGGRNSVLNVDARFEKVERKRGDGRIESGSLQFTPGFPDLNRLSPEFIEITFRSAAGDVESVEASPGGDMRLAASDMVSDIWRVKVSTDALVRAGELRFAVRDAQKREDRGPYTLSLEALPAFYTPDWVADGIFYQIFPDRFHNGDRSNDPDFDEWYYEGLKSLPASGKTNGEFFHMVEDWQDYGGLTHSPYRTDGRPDYYSFYGGDIAGVGQRLDYLAGLGVTILYFNPITEGKSNHKYDATDYLTVDPHFATPGEFRSFVSAAHAKGIRIVVEAVFNHCGDTHWAFVDSRDKGAQSAYWDWFEWKKWPLPKHGNYKAADYYECWWGFGLHPNLNFDLSRTDSQESGVRDIAQAVVNQPLVDHLLEVARYWLEDMDVDGFRMDVPNDAPFWFWKLFRERVKGIKPDAYLVGELWGYAPDWIGPDVFDATMNYKYFRDPVTAWIGSGRGNAAKFERDIAPGRTAYPSQAVRVMMNLIDSHDTVRFVTLAKGDRRRLQMAALFTMTYVGTPHIWYGDEIGMEGEKDPDCRRPFYWDYESDPGRVALRDYYKKLTALRHEYEALRRGSFRTLLAEGQDYAYLREGKDERLITVIHNVERGATVTLDLAAAGLPDGDWRPLVGGADPTLAPISSSDGRLTVTLTPLSGMVLVQE